MFYMEVLRAEFIDEAGRVRGEEFGNTRMTIDVRRRAILFLDTENRSTQLFRASEFEREVAPIHGRSEYLELRLRPPEGRSFEDYDAARKIHIYISPRLSCLHLMAARSTIVHLFEQVSRLEASERIAAPGRIAYRTSVRPAVRPASGTIAAHLVTGLHSDDSTENVWGFSAFTHFA